MNSGAAVPIEILVVEDRAPDRMALCAMLESPDYTLIQASSGSEALHKLLTSDFAVMLLDVVMPEMSGFEVATLVRQRERTASLPIIFMTGEGSDVALVYRGYRTGAVDYLVKPLVPEIVRAKVGVFVELYRQRKLLVEAEHQQSELRLAELRLASERHYRQLAETVPDIIWMASVDGKVEYLNQRWFQYTGLSAEESSATGWRSAIHPDDAERIDDAWTQSIRTGRTFEMQARVRASDGSYRWHLARAVAEPGAGAQIVSWLGTFTDIEDQKRIEEVLTEFKGTLDAVLDAVLIFHPETLDMQYANRGASLLTNRSRRELLALRPFDLVVDFDEQRFREFLAPLREGSNRVVSAELLWRRRGAADVPVDASFQLVLIDGTRIVCIARDATERRLAELERQHLYDEAVTAVRVRDDFISVASHELRTPLTSLQLHLDVLRRARKPAIAPLSADRVAAKIEAASRQVNRLSRLVAELLDVSRMGAGRLQIEPVEVDLVGVTRDVIGRLAEDAERAGSVVTLRADEGVVGQWDALRIEQVVTNLLSNALKFGAGKPVEVAVERDGPLARISVRDHGIGIAREDIDRIFLRFERAVSGRHYGGFGLGLYIVYQIAEAHGGRVRAESSAGEGATFIVELPLERPTSKEEQPSLGPVS